MNNVELLAGALAYMEEHLCEDIRTEEVAAACFCSKSTLERLFRCVNEITVREYLIKRRMTKAARTLVKQPQKGILEVALSYGYSSNESFTRAFKQVWNCKPSEFRGRKNCAQPRVSELFPRLTKPLESGDAYMRERKPLDISELYDLFVTRKECYFVCCDIKQMKAINEISSKAGDMAILTAMQRMEAVAGENDIVFRIGGDEFALITDSTKKEYAETLAEKIRLQNGQEFSFEGQQVPLNLRVSVAVFGQDSMRYNELFTGLHTTIRESK